MDVLTLSLTEDGEAAVKAPLAQPDLRGGCSSRTGSALALQGHAPGAMALAQILSQSLGSPVRVDTGLQGLREFDVAYSGEMTTQTLDAALREQLGLTLRAERIENEALVVEFLDEAED